MACIIEGISRWPSKDIPYLIDVGNFDENAINKIIQGINLISNSTNVNLFPRRNELHYLFFTKGEACGTKVGYRGGLSPNREYKHVVKCDVRKFGSDAPDAIAHEICHALGVWHEQSRQDRDDHISVQHAHILEGEETQFSIHSKDGLDYGPYDYNSIMHYPENLFAIEWVINKEVFTQTSKAPPSLATFNGNLHMVHLGDTSNNIWHSWFDGNNWTPTKQPPAKAGGFV